MRRREFELYFVLSISEMEIIERIKRCCNFVSHIVLRRLLQHLSTNYFCSSLIVEAKDNFSRAGLCFGYLTNLGYSVDDLSISPSLLDSISYFL